MVLSISEDSASDQELDIEPEEEQGLEPGTEESEPSPTDAEPVPAAPELGAEIEEEIKRVIVTEEPAPKAKNQLLPEDLIKKELEVEDLFDEGSI